MKKKISIIDDNVNLLTSLSLQLQDHNYETICFADPEEALRFHSKNPVDFYILDYKMPRLTGIEFYELLCQKLEVKRFPAIILSAIGNLEAHFLKNTSVLDFVHKPFSFTGLLARIEKIINEITPKVNESYKLGNLCLYENELSCTWFSSNKIDLTKIEFELLKRLVKRPRCIFTRNQLLDIIYPNNYDVSDRTIDSHIKRLRKKFKKAHPEKKFDRIKTFYGSGYSWNQKQISIS